ncbi:MAG TPA: glycosyl hydrolase 108 family protein, partial [Acidimicrobiia bacterium]
MAKGNFPKCLAVTLTHEGGYVNHPRDPGGATNLGVTHKTLAAHLGRPVSKQDVRNLTQGDVEPIYRRGYWLPVKGENLPHGVDLAVFDFGVNSGPSRSAKYLQGVVGVAKDGKIGPKTLIAVHRK